MCESDGPSEFRARIIDFNRDAYELFRETLVLIESAVTKSRDNTTPYARALDFLFIQAYKSFTAIYFLAVRGHGEDAATILRRLLEISFQVGYLAKESDERGLRGTQYLAYYWAQVPELQKLDLDEKVKASLEALYKEHKRFIAFNKKGRVKNWWDGSIRDLADRLGLITTYDQDYKFLSQMAHGTSQGILMDAREERIEIRSDVMVQELFVFASRYMLGSSLEWNNHFRLIENEQLDVLTRRALNFDFSRKKNRNAGTGV